MNALIVASHPDDEVLGCGGTIARLAQEGVSVHILILGEGITSRPGLTPLEISVGLATLHQQAQSVADMLGAKKLVLENLPDNRFDTVPFLNVVQIIERVIADTQPNIIYTQHGGDLNVDHTITFRATLTAVRPMVASIVKSLYAFEVASSTEWAFQKFSPVFRPARFIDIDSTLDLKLKAMKLYEGEDRTFPHPRSADALRAQAMRWGSTSGLQAAEAFDVIFERV